MLQPENRDRINLANIISKATTPVEFRTLVERLVTNEDRKILGDKTVDRVEEVLLYVPFCHPPIVPVLNTMDYKRPFNLHSFANIACNFNIPLGSPFSDDVLNEVRRFMTICTDTNIVRIIKPNVSEFDYRYSVGSEKLAETLHHILTKYPDPQKDN